MMVVASSSASKMYAVAQLEERRSRRYLHAHRSPEDGRGADEAGSLFQLQGLVRGRDPSLWVPLPPRLLHDCRRAQRSERSQTGRGSWFRRGLTGVGGAEVVGVAGEEGLVVLSRQVHVVVGQRLATRDPRIPAPRRTEKELLVHQNFRENNFVCCFILMGKVLVRDWDNPNNERTNSSHTNGMRRTENERKNQIKKTSET